ncbi:MAG: flagellar biosynthetic protein FliR [Nocardioidaceae bacterium]|nr:flagellar biosynthetic protein FliR [Nocardioidaceae bacterium]
MEISLPAAPIVAVVLASVRIVAWLMVAPPFSSRAVPVTVKVLLALGLSLVVAPRMTGIQVPRDVPELLGSALQEALIGATLGFVTYLVLAAVQTAGDLIDVFGGFQLASAFDPLSQNMNAIHGKLFSMLGVMLLFATNAYLLVIGGVLRTFERAPVGTAWQPSSAAEVVTTAFGLMFTAAVQVALPVIGVLCLADLGLALLTKVAPQLNAIGIMFPAKIGLTLIVVGLSFAVLPETTTRLVDHLSDAFSALV